VIDGLLVIDKPAGMTSHDVVARCRRAVGQKRVGHAGTLDPSATGVLLVGLGRATRLMQFVSSLKKSYECELVLGTATSTLDADGEVTGEWDMSAVTLDDVVTASEKFVGDIEQIPPMVSAVKVDGKRLHQLAREGIEVERKPRPVTVYSLDVASTSTANVFRMRTTCSSGTYVRTLAADIGEALGGGAHLRALRRTAIGPFNTIEAHALDDAFMEHADKLALPPLEMVRHLPMVAVDAASADDVGHGRPLASTVFDTATFDRQADARDDGMTVAGGPWAVVNDAHELVAVYERTAVGYRPAVVLDAR
jgi:tRNA pseudouridine55 synthase